jgi:hypothetical protein
MWCIPWVSVCAILLHVAYFIACCALFFIDVSHGDGVLRVTSKDNDHKLQSLSRTSAAITT